MSNGHVFISHATADDDFVRQLREGLAGQGIAVWVDSRNLRGGDKLAPDILKCCSNFGTLRIGAYKTMN